MRNLLLVLNEIETVFENNGAIDEFPNFKSELDSYKYTAPEDLNNVWDRCYSKFCETAPWVKPTENWHWEVLSIWTTMDINELIKGGE